MNSTSGILRACAAIVAAAVVSSAGAVSRPVPRPALMERLLDGPEVIGIVHWGPNTYIDKEWGYGDADPQLLDPPKFDADQIAGAAKAGGIGGLVVVAKHHDGFCLWPTKTTDYNIAKTPFWRGTGNGERGTGRDYVKEMEQACRRHGLRFGVYVSPWDRHDADYASEAYVEKYHEQIRELTGGGYGEIFELWFDGANGGDGFYGGAREQRKIGRNYYRFGEVLRFVKERNPSVTVFGGGKDGDFRWPGNERGLVEPDSRATCPGFGQPEGVLSFKVFEADFPLRKGWFWHAGEKGTTKNAAYLTKLYLSSVGNGGTMDIGLAPNKDGQIDEADAKALAGFDVMRRALFAHEAKVGEPFNVVVMQEDISQGERVDGWQLVADGKVLLEGKSIGVKRIRVLETPCAARSCAVKVTEAADGTAKVSLRLYMADVDMVKTILASSTKSGETDTARWMTAAAAVQSEAVTYEQFGAVGDGVADDQAAIVAAHAAANEKGLPVKTGLGKTYRIGGGDRVAVIRTDVDFGDASFVIDDTAVKNRKAPVFLVESDSKALNIGKMKPLKRGAKEIGQTLPGPCHLELVYDGVRRYIREGLNCDAGEPQREVLVVDASGKIDAATPVLWDYPSFSRVMARPVDAKTLVIRGGSFTTIANRAESKYNYHSRGIRVERSNVRILGLRHAVTGELDHGAPYMGFIEVFHASDVEVEDCVFTAHRTYKTIGSARLPVPMGSYDITVNNSANVVFRNCRQTTDIADWRYWGIFSSNHCKGLTFDGCVFSRFDAHKGVAGATIRNCELGHQGINAIGAGTFLVENTRIRSSSFFNLRSDYGSTWDGEFIVKNCVFAPPKCEKAFLVRGKNAGRHDFGYACTMPRKMIFDGLTIEDSDVGTGGVYLFDDFVGDGRDRGEPAPHEYRLTEKVVLSDVSLSSGHDVKICPNASLFEKLVVGRDEKPLKVLMIGNSFSICNLYEMPNVAAAMGKRLDLASLFIGGCSLERHWNNFAAATTNATARMYRFDRKVDGFKTVNEGKINIQEALALDKWDVVTIQQASHLSWKPESYEPFASSLVAKIRELAPQAKIVVQETWSYPPWDKRLEKFGFDQAEMYARLHAAYGALAAKYGFDVIPVGTAAEIVPDRNSLFRKSDFHFGREGVYLQGLAFAACLYGEDVGKCPYKPEWMKSSRAEEIKAAVMSALAERKPAKAL